MDESSEPNCSLHTLILLQMKSGFEWQRRGGEGAELNNFKLFCPEQYLLSGPNGFSALCFFLLMILILISSFFDSCLIVVIVFCRVLFCHVLHEESGS